jgi:hypothetical protein
VSYSSCGDILRFSVGSHESSDIRRERRRPALSCLSRIAKNFLRTAQQERGELIGRVQTIALSMAEIGQLRLSANGERFCKNGLQVDCIDRPVEPSVE